jgi:hypothetical protein
MPAVQTVWQQQAHNAQQGRVRSVLALASLASAYVTDWLLLLLLLPLHYGCNPG